MLEIVKRPVRAMLPVATRVSLRRAVLGRFYRNDLNRLRAVFEADKVGDLYTYERHFGPQKHRRMNVIEIGIGGWDGSGYSDPHRGGNSLRMWKAYFPNSRIYGIDIFDKTPHDADRIKTFRGSQTDEAFLTEVVGQTGPPDIIIDDGSHVTDHVIATFKILFPLLEDDGIYVIEDLQTSYWPDWNGSPDVTAEHTSMSFLKGLLDGLNHAERQEHEPDYFDLHIKGLHFYHNLVFIEKGLNDRPSNMVVK